MNRLDSGHMQKKEIMKDTFHMPKVGPSFMKFFQIHELQQDQFISQGGKLHHESANAPNNN